MAYPFRSTASIFAASAIVLAAACNSDEVKQGPRPDAGEGIDGGGGVTAAPDGKPWQTLAEWHLFADAKKQEPTNGVIPYEVNSALFADYAEKHRFLYVPKGEKIAYSDTDLWGFPEGTILVKTFAFYADARDPSKGERLIETRLLIHEADGWRPRTYVWNDDQTEATLKTGGADIDVEFTDGSGKSRTDTYSVPGEADCRTCHGKLGQTDTLGGRTRQLDRTHDYGDGPVNQIDHLKSLGLMDGDPAPAADRVHLVDPFGTDGTLDERARSYLDGNCAHCHQEGAGQGAQSGLYLDYPSTAAGAGPPARMGICKLPASAGGATCGYSLDIVPGRPDVSIYVCRMESTNPKFKMPSVGRNLVHDEGVQLITDWIRALPGDCGQGPAPSPDAGSVGDGG